jgi:hypothetical protein
MSDTCSRYDANSSIAAGEPVLLTEPVRNSEGSFSFMNIMGMFLPVSGGFVECREDLIP